MKDGAALGRAPTLLEIAARVATLSALALWLAACTGRPVNPPVSTIDLDSGYRLNGRTVGSPETMVVLAFSGGGMRAAAFSYGVLEYLKQTEVVTASGERRRLLDEVDVVAGVSGGSLTALAYGLYGDQLFSWYETEFLKRNVQAQLIGRILNPINIADTANTTAGRSEIAERLFDDLLFKGATYKDLRDRQGPMIVVSATDIATGGRFPFYQDFFDTLCSDLSAMKLARAAAASSAVPVVLSPVTVNNYGGRCPDVNPSWKSRLLSTAKPPQSAVHVVNTIRTQEGYRDGKARPFIHLVDGGVSDNLAMRSVIDALEIQEVLFDQGVPTPLENIKRIVVVVVNSLSIPSLNWSQSELPPSTVDILIKAIGVPIDSYSWETVELLNDMAARWRKLREVRELSAMRAVDDPRVAAALRAPDTDVFVINVSFAALDDPTERAYLNQLPTSLVLPDEAIDRLRSAAGTIISQSPEFRRVMKTIGLKAAQ